MKTCQCSNYSSEKGICWKFTVENTPWMGGYYERLVGRTKRSLGEAIGCSLFIEMQLLRFIKEVESVDQPLLCVGDDVNSVTLRPANFLILNPKIGIWETITT
jgi:hypothetical protein